MLMSVFNLMRVSFTELIQKLLSVMMVKKIRSYFPRYICAYCFRSSLLLSVLFTYIMQAFFDVFSESKVGAVLRADGIVSVIRFPDHVLPGFNESREVRFY